MSNSTRVGSRSARKKCEWMSVDPVEVLLLLLGAGFKDHVFLFKAILIGCATYIELFNVICIVEALAGKRWYFRQFITMIILQQPGCCGLLLLSHFIKDVLNFQTTIFSNYWAADSCGTSTEKKILRDSKMCLASCMGQTLLGLITHLLFFPIVGDEDRICFSLKFFYDHFGKWAKVPVFLFYACMLMLCYGTLAALNGCLYICYHIRFQLYLLNEYIREFRVSDVEDVDQEAVYEEISILIAHHVRVRKVSKALLTVQNIPLLLFYITGALAGVSGLYFVLTNVSPSSNFRMVFVTMLGVTMSVTACVCSQKLIDQSNELIVSLSNTPWIYWSEKNRKAILLLMVNCLEPIRLSCFGLMDINYNFLLFFVRMIYSLIAVVVKIK